ncbi:hypothetical protein FE257_011081 [Aspergillus nanangensis]|uniref:Uncharacterized protein n=1 Tax=Aspergillus nanangensis TaxID=2582783 RepID=A0AAD4CHY6_ASPNN|nr:hypothetical protein FE257_011081 [Aspergillus nanangensis]
MDMFSLSPLIPSTSKVDGCVEPINIPFDGDEIPYSATDEKAKEVADALDHELDNLMENFTRGFDPGKFDDVVKTSLPILHTDLFPGSYNHLLVILLEDLNKMETTQIALEDGLRERYKCWTLTHPSDTSITDETFFGAEIEILRKLLAPLRDDGDTTKVYWMNTRRPDRAKVCWQLETSVRVIREFKRDVLAAMESKNDDMTIYNPLPVSTERSADMSIKQHRIDACKATLSWDGFRESDIELTTFYQFYKEYVSTYEPAKARASGWLPPKTLEAPHISTKAAKEQDLVSWPTEHRNNITLSLLLKTAMWLSVARGLAAVHLFCDVARFFTLYKPPKLAKPSYICFLQHLTQLRVSIDGIQSHLPTPFPFRDEVLADYNPDYFDDVWKSNRTLAVGLAENLSLLKSNSSGKKLVLSKPPTRTCRALRKEIRSLAQTVVIHGSLAGSWPLKGNINHRKSLPGKKPMASTPTE